MTEPAAVPAVDSPAVPAPHPFLTQFQAWADQASAAELCQLAHDASQALEGILEQGFTTVNEGFNPDEGTKPIVLIREQLLPLLAARSASETAAAGLDTGEPKIVFNYFKSEHPVDLALKTLQDKLRLFGHEETMKAYIDFTNTLEKTIHGGLTANAPLFVKAEQPADTLYVVFAGMVCFPEFKKSIQGFGNVDQLHILDPHRSWYMQGPEGEWNGYEHYSRILRDEISRRRAETPYRRISFLGNSMGGSAACLFCEHADAVLAFCPQTEIVRKDVPEDVAARYKTLFRDNLLKAHAAGKSIHIHRGVGPNDIIQCGRLPEEIVPTVHESCTVHNLPGHLKAEGTLLDILGSLRRI